MASLIDLESSLIKNCLLEYISNVAMASYCTINRWIQYRQIEENFPSLSLIELFASCFCFVCQGDRRCRGHFEHEERVYLREERDPHKAERTGDGEEREQTLQEDAQENGHLGRGEPIHW